MNVYTVYRKYNKDFIAFARSITRNEDTAFDMVQEAYVSALENEEIFQSMNEYQIKGWFFRVIKNKNIDYVRKQSKVLFIEDDLFIEDSSSFEEDILFNDVLEKLPEKYRQVLILKYKKSLNSTEIGKILGISPSTVRSRLSASLKLLKNYLQGV